MRSRTVLAVYSKSCVNRAPGALIVCYEEMSAHQQTWHSLHMTFIVCYWDPLHTTLLAIVGRGG
jgi:hypothetical protein